MKKSGLILIIAFLVNSQLINGQVAVTTDGTLPDNSAMLDVKSSSTGLLLPRLSTEQRNLVPTPAAGLIIYNTSSDHINYYSGTKWCQVEITSTTNSTGALKPGGGISVSGGSGNEPEGSAMLDISDNSRGVLIPRTIPGAITAPATGLIIFNTAAKQINYFDGTAWKEVCASSTGISGATGTQEAKGMAVNTSSSMVNQSAILDVAATNKGILIPRLSETQRDNLDPAEGLMIYNLTMNVIEFYNGTGWFKMNLSDYIDAPVEAIHEPLMTQVTWKWHQADSADGYRWNTVNDFYTAIDKGADTTHTETGLTCLGNFTRYVWAYSTCGSSTPITLDTSTLWCCGAPIPDPRDGQVYNTVQIGTQCWLAQNLNYGTMIAASSPMANDGMVEKYCYENAESRCLEYGALYQWDEAMQYVYVESTQGICPSGWHIPSEAEWVILENFLGSKNVAGGKMKETGYVHWVSPNTGATNSSGFTARAGGYNAYTDATPWSNLRTHNYIWASTPRDATTARRRGLFYFSAQSYPYFDLKSLGFSVRCLKTQ
jgi:uncharacterized protein (TIGR02145 family)